MTKYNNFVLLTMAGKVLMYLLKLVLKNDFHEFNLWVKSPRALVLSQSTSGGDIYYFFFYLLPSHSAWNKKWKNPNEKVKYEHEMWSHML